MHSESCAAMLLAGGEGRRLGVLTREKAKPAVHFGGSYRIIDFALSNCKNSGIHHIGVITQYKAASLHTYIGSGKIWSEGVTLLPPKNGVYTGTADAVFKNNAFLAARDPEHVLILSGDHIYRMDYRPLLQKHRESGADLTIVVTPVAWEEAHRFGILRTDEDGRVTAFAEKPEIPQSNLASMGIYVFRRSYLMQMLEQDAANPYSSHDFGRDVIPAILTMGDRIQTHAFEGYWRDVGTLGSLWEAHMDLLGEKPRFDCQDQAWPMYSFSRSGLGQGVDLHLGKSGRLHQSLAAGSCAIFGEVERSVVSAGAIIGQGSVLRSCVVMPGAQIGSGAFICNAIIGEGAVVEDGASLCGLPGEKVAVIGDAEVLGKPEKLELQMKLKIPLAMPPESVYAAGIESWPLY